MPLCNFNRPVILCITASRPCTCLMATGALYFIIRVLCIRNRNTEIFGILFDIKYVVSRYCRFGCINVKYLFTNTAATREVISSMSDR